MNKKQLQKMLRLADVKKPLNEGLKTSAIELIKSAADGNTYAIVRENRTYYIMKTETKTQLTESDFNYIGGLQNRTKNSFRAFDDAVSRLNLMFNDINRERRISESVDMKTFDYILKEGVYVQISEDKEQLDEKKFILKQPKPKKEEPSMDFGDEEGGEPEFDFGGEETADEEGGDEFDFGGDEEGGEDEFDFGDEGESEEGGDEEFDFEAGEEGGEEEMEFDMGSEEGGDSIKDIQRTTGKLGQQLRDTEDLSSDMQKWVAKSVISALKLDTMDDADKDDVINALESGGSKEEGPEVDFMEDEEPTWEYQGGRTLSDDEFGPSGSGEEDEDDILLDDEGMGGYLGWEEDEEYEEIPMKDIDMPIRDKGYLNIDPDVAGGNTSYMDDDLEVGGPVVYMTDDDMEPCMSDDCDEPMDEGMSKWNDADNESGMGWETNEGVSYMGDDYTEEDIDRMLGNDDIYGMNNPAPAKPKEKEKAPTRPSKSPFSPPERIRPGEEPRPKAEVDYMAEPAPSQEPDIAEPTTKPGTDRPVRPSTTPFSPPERIRPGEEPRPKADYDDDVTFE
jgi:hypothetical protein